MNQETAHKMMVAKSLRAGIAYIKAERMSRYAANPLALNWLRVVLYDAGFDTTQTAAERAQAARIDHEFCVRASRLKEQLRARFQEAV